MFGAFRRRIILPELPKRLAFLVLASALALGSIWPASAAGPHPNPPPQAGEGKSRLTAAPTLPSPKGGGKFAIQKFDPSIERGREISSSGGGRSPAAPNVITGGAWTPLGPTPIADEKNIGPTPQTPSDYGRASGA